MLNKFKKAEEKGKKGDKYLLDAAMEIFPDNLISKDMTEQEVEKYNRRLFAEKVARPLGDRKDNVLLCADEIQKVAEEMREITKTYFFIRFRQTDLINLEERLAAIWGFLSDNISLIIDVHSIEWEDEELFKQGMQELNSIYRDDDFSNHFLVERDFLMYLSEYIREHINDDKNLFCVWCGTCLPYPFWTQKVISLLQG